MNTSVRGAWRSRWQPKCLLRNIFTRLHGPNSSAHMRMHLLHLSLLFSTRRTADSITDSDGWDTAYMGVHELCMLTNPSPCQPGGHRTCLARKLVDTYQHVKHVTMVGGLTGAYMHIPGTSYMDAYKFRRFAVVKRNTKGKLQRRWVVVDTINCVLVNLDATNRVRKKLPLVQLIQIEKLLADPTRLNLVFSGSATYVAAATQHRRALDKLLETVYSLTFEDARTRQEFVDEVLRAQANLPALLGAAREGDAAAQTAAMATKAAASGAAGGSHPAAGTPAAAAAPGSAAAMSPARPARSGLAAAVVAAASQRGSFTSPSAGQRAAAATGSAPAPAPAPHDIGAGAQPGARAQSAGPLFKTVRRGSLTSKILAAAREEYHRQLDREVSLQELRAMVTSTQRLLADALATRAVPAPAALTTGSDSLAPASSVASSLLVELREQRELLQALRSEVAQLRATHRA